LKKNFLLIAFSLLLSVSLTGQHSETKTYDELKKLYEEAEKDSLKKVYAKEYLKKAKSEKDPVKIADGYKRLGLFFYPGLMSTRYADSIIDITKQVEDKNYPALGYLLKGANLYESGSYKKALDTYLTGLKYAKKNKNQVYLKLMLNIGLIRNITDEREKAQKTFKEYLDILEEVSKEITIDYLSGLYALADSYVYSQKLDFADGRISTGIEYSLKLADSAYYSSFVFTSGLSSYFKGNYNRAIDSITKANRFFSKDTAEATRSALCNYYIGKSLIGLRQEKKSISYFQKVDSILNITDDITPELIDAYKPLIENAKQHENKELQVRYLNSFIKYDSILDANSKDIKKAIEKEYDIETFIEDKERLLSEIDYEEKRLYYLIGALVIGLIISFTVLFFNVRRNTLNIKKYEDLIQQIKDKPGKQKKKNKANNTFSGIGISEQVVKGILVELEKFESSNGFTNRKCTLPSLAKNINTNTAHLSKVINVVRGTNFPNYLNNLRIDYAIDKLSHDKQFRLYTIQAIAESCGFNTAQSFTNAFRRKTKLYPAYFIKRLKNKEKNLNI